MQKFHLFQERLAALGEDDVEPKFRAIPENQILTGIFTPFSHPELFPEPVSIIEAASAEAALAEYQARRANMVL